MKQGTLKNSISFTGTSLFSGKKTTIFLERAKANHGIVFQRMDLPSQPKILATLDEVFHTSRTTALGKKGEEILMVEHLLAALFVSQIDNLLIKVDGNEIPSFDGSANGYLSLIEEAKREELDVDKEEFFLHAPVYYADKETYLIAMPSDHLHVSFTLCYPGHPLLDAQYFSYPVDKATFSKEIAPARTFALYEEVLELQKQGIVKHSSLDQAVVIKGKEILSLEPLRFQNEMVRHKILDLLGDLSLIGKRFSAHIFSIRSGHGSHVHFAKMIRNALKKEKNL